MITDSHRRDGIRQPTLSRRQVVVGAAAALASAGVRGDDAASPPFRAAAAETVVSPDAKGTFLIGPMKPSTGIHDDLHARALVLAQGEQMAAIVTIDFLGFDFAYNEVLLAAISRASGIPADRLLIACSHTHSAPITAPWGPWERAKDRPFHERLPRQLAEVVTRAVERLEPARLRVAREPVQIGFNRRTMTNGGIVMAPNPAGTVLPWVDVLAADTLAGQSIGVLFSHAAHPVIVHGASTLISADYPGFAVQTLRQAVGKDAICMFAQGCCGNINAFPLRGGIDAAKAAGKDLGQAAARALHARPTMLAPGGLRVVSRELALPLQRDVQRTMPFPMRAIAIGDLCILAVAHELFAEYGRFVEQITPFPHTVMLAYTNGLECYVGTAKDYELGNRGGYEIAADGAARMFGAALDVGCEARVQEGLRHLLAEARAGS